MNPRPRRSRLLSILAIAALLATPVFARVHDPSTIIRSGSDYWIFSTGQGILSWHSRDLKTWAPGPPVFSTPPAWAAQAVPGEKGYFWAPEIMKLNGRYCLYYAVSTWGSRTSAIGLATNATLDPTDPAFHWQDQGIVLRSSDHDDFNAIDPSLLLDPRGRLWMSFGSFWSGIKVTDLNPATGLAAADAPLHALAWAPQIEASYLLYHEGSYFLFVNWGYCCQGVKSTYTIHVGRASAPTGPYLDQSGKNMLKGGGTLFLGNEGPRIGPGQIGVFHDTDGADWFSYHYYDANRNGAATLGVRHLSWTPDNWPEPGAEP